MAYRKAYRKKDGTFVSASNRNKVSYNFKDNKEPNYIAIIVVIVIIILILI